MVYSTSEIRFHKQNTEMFLLEVLILLLVGVGYSKEPSICGTTKKKKTSLIIGWVYCRCSVVCGPVMVYPDPRSESGK